MSDRMSNRKWKRCRARQRVALAQLERLAEALAFYSLAREGGEAQERLAAQCWAEVTTNAKGDQR